jgi:hypothetical protein
MCNEDDVLKLLVACVMVSEELTGPIGQALQCRLAWRGKKRKT